MDGVHETYKYCTPSTISNKVFKFVTQSVNATGVHAHKPTPTKRKVSLFIRICSAFMQCSASSDEALLNQSKTIAVRGGDKWSLGG